jgi:hypothetical protein
MSDAKNSKPVFIVGMNGSGTTFLLDCLNNHPDLYGYRRETKIIPLYFASQKKYGDLKNDQNFLKLFDALRNEYIFKVVNGGVSLPLPGNWKQLPRNLATIIDTIFMYFASKDGKSRWCEKTPAYAIHIKELCQLFPDAKFIHLIRDGRDCARSLHRRYGYNAVAMIYRWKKIVGEARRQGAQTGDRYLEIRYEEMTEHPERIMKQICSHLEIPFSSVICESSRIRNFTGNKSSKIIKNSKKWREYFDRKKLRRMEMIAGRQLNELGYETNYPDADCNPSNLLLQLLLYFGYTSHVVKRSLKAVCHGDFVLLQGLIPFLMTRIKTRSKI